jgi:glucose-6-phosphate dehydrogenase assembly protein OpcA
MSAATLPSPDSLARLGTEVPLGKIDSELTKLWDDDAKTRASLLNFAIYSEDTSSLETNVERLDRIISLNACRALLILRMPGEAPSARAWINALCHPYQGRQAVCSEQISFLLEDGDAAQLQNVVFAHLDSDLPLVVWWQGPLTQNFEERFYSHIDTLIIDSSTWNDPKTEFAELAAALETGTADFDVRDLSWTRSHFLRLALASSFEDDQARQKLNRLSEVEIVYAPGRRAAALLLAGWLAKRLGASLKDTDSDFIFHREDGLPIRAILTEQPGVHCLKSLTLRGEGLSVEITRSDDSPFVRVASSCGEHSHEELLPADADTEADLVADQLSRAGGTTLYADMIPTMRQLLER